MLYCSRSRDGCFTKLLIVESFINFNFIKVDRGSGHWKITEQDATEREALLFPGIYLAYLTGGYLTATLHRVVKTKYFLFSKMVQELTLRNFFQETIIFRKTPNFDTNVFTITKRCGIQSQKNGS